MSNSPIAASDPVAMPINETDIQSIVNRVSGPNIKILKSEYIPLPNRALGFMGTYMNLSVLVEREGRAETLKFFIKYIPKCNNMQVSVIESSNAYFKEVAFNERILPLLLTDLKPEDCEWVVPCYLTKPDAIVFEDMKSRGFSVKSLLLDEEHVRSALGSIARLHASSLLAERRLGRSLGELFPEEVAENLFVRDGTSYAKWFESGFEVAVGIAKHLNLEGAEDIGLLFEPFCEKLKASRRWPNVICHGDLKSFNIMFDQKARCALVDFQMLRYVPRAVDILQLLYLCTRQEMREKNEIDFLKHYHSVFCNTLRSNCPTFELPLFDELLDEFEDLRIIGFSTILLYSPIYLMDEDTIKSSVLNPENFGKLFEKERIDLVKATMSKNKLYNEHITEIITYGIERLKQLINL